MRVIPAIDIIDGKCVRLTQGDYAQKKIYNEDPLEVAKAFEDGGIGFLHLVDLDGAKSGKVINWKVVENLTQHTGLQIDFGGGIKTEGEVKNLFDLNVKQVNLGSIAVKQPDLVSTWITTFGAEKIILSADVKNEKVAVSGWQETSTVSIGAFIEDYLTRGILYVTCTDISTDGMLSGPNVSLYKKLLSLYPSLKLIASGGVSGVHDLQALADSGVEGVIVGKAFYEGRITLNELTHAY